MLVDGEPGRYIHSDGEWIFESGDFNNNESFDLRVKNIIEILDENSICI